MNELLQKIIKTEYLFAAIFVALFTVQIARIDWWWLFLLLPVFELSSLGYLLNKKTGAHLYNLFHSFVGAFIALTLHLLFGYEWLLILGLSWLFSISINRALGLGLKHEEGWHTTHMGSLRKSTTKK